MIQPLRAAHRRAVFALAAALPAVFAVGLAARRPETPANPAVAWDGKAVRWLGRSAFRLANTEAGIRRSADGAWVEISTPRDLLEPDLLAYWSPAASHAGVLPADGRLIGTIAGRRMRLPDAARSSPGCVSVYSLAHESVVGTVQLSLP